MKVDFDTTEAWTLLSHVVNRLLDETPLEDADRARIRRWKSEEMKVTSQEMQVLAQKLNQDLEQVMSRKTKSQLRRADWQEVRG